jgi:hypothetical protein
VLIRNYRNISVFTAVLTDWWERLSAAIEMIKFHFYRGWKAAPTGQKDNRFKAAKFLALIRRAAL